MVNSKKDDDPRSHRKPPASPEAYQNRLIALAYDEAERLLLAGQASSQVITQLLRMGTKREELEIKKLENEGLLAAAKYEQIEQQTRAEELLDRAMAAFRGYQPSTDDDIE